jgi:hypothetical protein
MLTLLLHVVPSNLGTVSSILPGQDGILNDINMLSWSAPLDIFTPLFNRLADVPTQAEIEKASDDVFSQYLNMRYINGDLWTSETSPHWR